MTKARAMPCEACPYRKDVPSGLWAAYEYDKLRLYDQPTGSQPFGVFACHASPEALCHGWVVVHMNRGHRFELLALRISESWDQVIPEMVVELFESGNDAADFGQQDIGDPSIEAVEAVARLMKKHPRLEFEKVSDDD